MVEEARVVAHAEIESARAAAHRVEQALEEQEKLWKNTEKQVRGIETITTYDSSIQEFIINTPYESAQKYWIGGVANVIIIQINGEDVLTQSIHVFHVGKMRIKLRKGRSTKAKEAYSAAMQIMLAGPDDRAPLGT